MKHGIRELDRITPEGDIGYIQGKAKRGCKAEFESACEVQSMLCQYTYHLIGLGNAFRDIARLYGKFEGSSWRSYRGVCGAELKALTEQLNSINPYDTDAILKIERAVEALAETLKVDTSVVDAKREARNAKARERRKAKRVKLDAEFKANLDSITHADVVAFRVLKGGA